MDARCMGTVVASAAYQRASMADIQALGGVLVRLVRQASVLQVLLGTDEQRPLAGQSQALLARVGLC